MLGHRPDKVESQATTKKRRTSTRKKKPTVAAKRQMTGNVIGLIGLLVTILALLKVGLVGMVFAEFFRAIAGNAYQIFAGLTLLVMGYLMIFGARLIR